MKISLEWLGEFVTWIEKDPQKIADALTLSTAEVEEVDVQGALLAHCCVGEVTNLRQHPGADRLKITDVKTDKGLKTVVCGGTNLRDGMLVAFAHVGATVKWHGGELMTLTPVKIRGEASEGMICAAEEIGLEGMYSPLPEDGERAIVDMSRFEMKGLKAGDSLKEVLNLNDAVLDINNTAITMRPDLFSHLGFARECVAIGLAKWKKKPAFKLPTSKAKGSGIDIKLDAKDLVPRYLGCMIEIDELGETPEWMKRRLIAAGWRPVSLPVDITNYVATEIGVPLHAFDADDIKGAVHLRLSKKGEKVETLDGKGHELPEGALVLSDDEGIFDFVGIMGGLRSSTQKKTKRLFLHALAIDPAVIRRAIVATGHRTDAATVYEKGVPAITAEHGFARAVELFLDLVPGAKIASSIESHGKHPSPKAITVTADDIAETLGVALKEKDVVDALESLEFDVEKKAKTLHVTPPLHRLRDIEGVHSLVEEVGRIRGFDTVPPTMPVAPMRLPDRDKRFHTIRRSLKEAGFSETVPLSFVSPSMLEKCGLPTSDAVEILNPLGEETSLLQTHTLPRLLVQIGKHLPLSEGDMSFFQAGHVFSKSSPEHLELSAVIAAKKATSLLDDPFLRTKQAIMDAARMAGYALTISKEKNVPPYAHGGRCAVLKHEGKAVGSVYEIHPSVRQKFDLPFRAAAATLNLHALFEKPAAIARYAAITRFPAVSYDVTINRTHKDTLGQLLEKVRSADALLEDVSVKDMYQPEGKDGYSLTLRFVYRSPERTLTEAEVKAAHEKVLAAAGL